MSERDEYTLPWFVEDGPPPIDLRQLCSGTDAIAVLGRTTGTKAVIDFLHGPMPPLQIEMDLGVAYDIELRLNALVEDRIGFVHPPVLLAARMTYDGEEITAVRTK